MRTPEAVRQRLLKEIATAWADTDPAAAADLVVGSMTPGRAQDDAAVAIVQRWSQTQPAAAAAWVARFPAGNLRDTALEELVKLWTDQDVTRAGNWLNDLGPGAARDVAVGAYVSKVALLSPSSAAPWAEEIRTDTLRAQKLEAVAEAWLAADAPAARTWIMSIALPETSKTRLLAQKSP